MKFPCLAYRSKWPNDWMQRWFYYRIDPVQEPGMIKLVLSLFKASFGFKKPLCNISGISKVAMIAYGVVCKNISTRCLVQEHLSDCTLPVGGKSVLSKPDSQVDHTKLVRLPFTFKPFGRFTKPNQEWLETIEAGANEIFGNFIPKEDRNMTEIFGNRPKRRLNRVFDAFGIDYPDYLTLSGEGAAEHKGKRTGLIERETKHRVAATEAQKRKKQRIKMSATKVPAAPGTASIIKAITSCKIDKKSLTIGTPTTPLLQKEPPLRLKE